jgi:hypothetical protein
MNISDLVYGKLYLVDSHPVMIGIFEGLEVSDSRYHDIKIAVFRDWKTDVYYKAPFIKDFHVQELTPLEAELLGD